MVKADVKQDYYADLEVPATADTEEIKKQFRLLAKQYHPDRNPGHEVEVVPKFQAVQAAHEILVDPIERAKYDTARAKQARANNPPPPPRDTDPYNFRRPARAATNPATTQYPFPPPPPPQPQQPKPKERPPYPAQQKPQPSVGADKFNAFTRANPQTWDRQRYEDAARAEAARGFSNMRASQPLPQVPQRPPRQHPTAPRTNTTTAPPDVPNGPNGVSPFPGLSRTASAQRMYQGTNPRDDPSDSRASAYAYVRGNRPPPTTTQTYTPEAYKHHSPPQPESRPGPHNLRHVRSQDQGVRTERPMYERSSSKYASNTNERTDINGPLLGRSTSVRNSPVDRQWEDPRAWSGRPHSHAGPPPVRHHSTSPKLRPSTGESADFSSLSSSSEDEPIHMNERPKAVPRKPKIQINPGLDSPFPSTGYTKVVEENSGQYTYPPPNSTGPTRTPFPDMASPDGAAPQEPLFSNAEPRQSVPDPIFQPAKFSHEDWAERFKSTSPSKRGSTSKRRPPSKPDISPDPMDVDPTDENPLHANGVDLNDMKNHAPFTSSGLDNTEDLATHLPFDSRASGKVKLERTHSRAQSSRLRGLALPRPPKEVIPPSEEDLTQNVWRQYVDAMKVYVQEWLLFEGKMIAHFQTRHEQVKSQMMENWISMATDGPSAEQIENHGSTAVNGTSKAGYAAYMEWFEDDVTCHTWWETANNHHRKCLEDLGRLRERIKKQ